MRLNYRLINVFTQDGGRLTGNPLCVFEDGSGLSTEQMQALALQFNLSETSFVMPSKKADARVRIFAPTYEMPFAGHPTLGTAHVVRDLLERSNHVSLELNVGVIPVTRDDGLWELKANSPTHRSPQASRAVLASVLGLEESDIRGEALWVNAGAEQLIVPVADPAAVQKARVSYESLAKATSDADRPTAYLFAETGPGTLLARFFFSKGDTMIEDPATGSATANLGGWFLANHASLPATWQISQGEMTGRPCTLRLRIDEARGVFVAGEVIELGRGSIDL